MKLNECVAIISEENVSRLSHLYGEIDINDLSRIVNNHLRVAIYIPTLLSETQNIVHKKLWKIVRL